MFLQFNPEAVAAAHAANSTAAGSASGMMHANSAACMPMSAGADPISMVLSEAFCRYQVGYCGITDNGIAKTHEGNGKLPESITNYETTDMKGGSRVGSTVFGTA
ncbi:PE domain-containing protein [Nocardia sp. NPDC052254]|uniref:PE domain-containing protein n=1 Tax=Nocardia sp. NPDC052254 TaxID=3155681 RepID=UPI0034333B2E